MVLVTAAWQARLTSHYHCHLLTHEGGWVMASFGRAREEVAELSLGSDPEPCIFSILSTIPGSSVRWCTSPRVYRWLLGYKHHLKYKDQLKLEFQLKLEHPYWVESVWEGSRLDRWGGVLEEPASVESWVGSRTAFWKPDAQGAVCKKNSEGAWWFPSTESCL